MMQAIIGIEIEVTELYGNFKLSQDKTLTEQKNIISFLEKSSDSNEIKIAHEMKKRLK